MKSVILIVLDGWGVAPPGPGNAIALARPTNIENALNTYPSTTLIASGEAVGLPKHEPGNTETGHINLGAGRVIYQDLPRINMEIADGTFYSKSAFLSAILHLKKTGGNLHLVGLIGEGTVHSSLDHLYALLYLAKENQIQNVFIHAITDGRDSPPQSAIEILGRLEEKLSQIGIGKIATVMGRYYAMDRDRRWERTEKAYRCMTNGSGHKRPDALTAVKDAYLAKKTDEFIEPTNISMNGKPIALVKEGDAVIFFNYRIDRPRQLTKAFVLDDFEAQANQITSFDPYAVKYYKTHQPQEQILTEPFKRGAKLKNLFFITMTEYEGKILASVAFPPQIVKMPLGKVVAGLGYPQLRMAESEKERFVTFYFNGQNEEIFPGEERIIIPSPKVATYDMKPEMSADELTNVLLQKINENKYRFILVNFANPDMVGHTGNIEASVSAIKAVDQCIGKILDTALSHDCSVLITADHGNVEQKINHSTGGISTEHTSNPVPLIIVDSTYHGKPIKLQSGILADVAPTILHLMGIDKPAEMTGRNLLEAV